MDQLLESKRQELHGKLVTLLGSGEVYFQPPETIKMKYPAIVYDMYRVNQRFADNLPYRLMPAYSITVIVRSADIDWIKKILESFEYCSVERIYTADNLVHYSFVIYYL